MIVVITVSFLVLSSVLPSTENCDNLSDRQAYSLSSYLIHLLYNILTLCHIWKKKRIFQAHTSLKRTFQPKNLPFPLKLPIDITSFKRPSLAFLQWYYNVTPPPKKSQEFELPHQKSTPNSIDASYKKVLQIILIIT